MRDLEIGGAAQHALHAPSKDLLFYHFCIPPSLL
jgi:hypothetical protein